MRRKKTLRSVVAGAALALALAGMGLAGSAQAAAISYNEPPDLPSDVSFAAALGNLGTGVNTVTGTIDCFPGCVPDEDWGDVFEVVLPVGLRLISITFNVSNFESTNAAAMARFIDLAGFNQPISGNGLLNLFNGSLDGTDDRLLFSAEAFPIDPLSESLTVFNYVWSFTVERAESSQAPAPATLALLGLALAGLGWSRRRK